MKIEAFETEAGHQAALAEIERLWNAREGTPEGDRLEDLVTLAEAYEEKHHLVASEPEELT